MSDRTLDESQCRGAWGGLSSLRSVAATIVRGLWGMMQPAMAVVLIVAGVVYFGRVRGVPRGMDNFAVVETGVGVAMPPDVLA